MYPSGSCAAAIFDQRVDIGFELRIGMDAQRVRRPLYDLVHVGVVERVSGRLPVFQRLAAEHGRRAFEQVHAAGPLALLKREWDRDRAIDLDLRRPEPVGQVHRGERHWLDRIVPRRACPERSRRDLRATGGRLRRAEDRERCSESRKAERDGS